MFTVTFDVWDTVTVLFFFTVVVSGTTTVFVVVAVCVRVAASFCTLLLGSIVTMPATFVSCCFMLLSI